MYIKPGEGARREERYLEKREQRKEKKRKEKKEKKEKSGAYGVVNIGLG